MATAIIPHLPKSGPSGRGSSHPLGPNPKPMMKGMAEANSIIDQAWINREALRLSKLAVRRSIRDRGGRGLKDFAAYEIKAMSEEWFDRHKASVVGHATVALVFRDCFKNARKSNTRAKPRKEIHG